MASNALCYGLKIDDDRSLDVSFPGRRETSGLGGSPARFMDMTFLLNHKAHHYCYRTRLTSNEEPDVITKDNQDIAFILAYMKAKGIRANREQCPWVVRDEFWKRFLRNNPGQEANLRAIGLQPAPTGYDPTSLLEQGDSRGAKISRRYVRAAGPARQSSGTSSIDMPPMRTISESQGSGGDSPISTPRADPRNRSNDGTPTSQTRLLRTPERWS